ncbi:sigma-70 family RNA polymerase sigma factor [Pseudomonas luteola]
MSKHSRILASSYGLLNSSDITGFTNFIKTIPRMDAKEEYEAFDAYRSKGCVESKNKIICGNLWLCLFMTKPLRFLVGHETDLVQEAAVGLVKAMDKYDHQSGYRFTTFARAHVKFEALEYVMSNLRIVKVATTKAKRKVFHNLYRFMRDESNLTQAKIKELALHLGVDETDIVSVSQHLSSNSSVSIDESFDEWMSSHDGSPEDIVMKMAEQSHNQKLVSLALQGLNEREKDIVTTRVMADTSVPMNIFAERYSVSVERIRQIEANALKKLHKTLAAA